VKGAMAIRKELIPGIIIAIVVIAGGFIYFKYDTNRKDRIFKEWNEKYPNITVQEHLQGSIADIMYQLNPELFRNDPHSAWIILDDSTKRRITASYELTKDLTLDEVLVVGDSLVKEADSDSLFIYKIRNGDTTKYSFRLEDDMGYPLKSKSSKEK